MHAPCVLSAVLPEHGSVFMCDGCKVQAQLTMNVCPGQWGACNWNCDTSKQVHLCKPHWP